MPKRQKEKSESFEVLLKKLQKLEKKVRRQCVNDLSDCSEPEEQDQAINEACENNVPQLLDDVTDLEPDIRKGHDPEPSTKSAKCVAAVINAPVPATEQDPSTSTSKEQPVLTDVALDNSIMEILGEDPTACNDYGAEIHKDLAVRLEHAATHGLPKELRKGIKKKYLLPNNCRLITAPALNAEIKAAISDIIAKRDKNIELRQKQMATAISCLSQVLNKLFLSGNADPAMTKMLMDGQRILCDCQYNDSVVRRNFILSSLKKDMKDQLQNTKVDNLLFGQNLNEIIKAAKAISKSGAELKTPIPKPPASEKLPATAAARPKHINWNPPCPSQKQPDHPKMKEPQPNKKRASNSSRHSQHQTTHSHRQTR